MSWLGLLSQALSLEDFLVVSSAATALLTFVALWHGLVVRDTMGRRVRELAEYRTVLKNLVRSGRRHRTRINFRESTLPLMRGALVKLNLTRGRQAENISLRLTRAGWRSKDAVVIYLFVKTALPFALGIGTLVYFAFGEAPTHPALRYAILLFGFAAGMFGTDLYVKNVGDKRIKKMNNALPDILDLLVICAEGGLSLDASITRVGREMAEAAPELAEELALTAVELGFLPDRQTALQNLGKRTDMPRLRNIVNSLAQTERYGTPLANTLRVLAAEFRDERMMRAEEKAAKLPAIMTVPMILFILPALFIVLCGPVALKIMDLMAMP
jgi:tight adherence protein C